MATYSTNEFKAGLKMILDGDPCSIIENEFVKPGKGQAFNRVRIRNLKNGKVLEKTFKSITGPNVLHEKVSKLVGCFIISDDNHVAVIITCFSV